MNIREIGIGMMWFVIAHIAVWFQLNGQFLWPWFRKNEWVIASTGMIISFFYIWGTKHAVGGFDGQYWPVRFLGFSIGILIYAGMVHHFFGEGVTLKTAISLILSVAIILIQILWK